MINQLATTKFNVKIYFFSKRNIKTMSEIINIPDEPIPGIKQTLSVFQMAEDAVASYTTVKKAYGYKNTLLGKLRSQRDTNPSVCDMVICIDNHKFPVHKCLMIVSSDYFEAMLRSGMQEARSNVIELKGKSKIRSSFLCFEIL